MIHILGISAFQHDSAAALLRDGEPLAAAQEERFSGRRFDPSFPRRAVRYCLREGGIAAGELDFVVFYEKPLRRFERMLATQLRAFPRSARVFSRTMFQWLGDRLWMKNLLCNEIGVAPDKVLFTTHHQAHAASVALVSPFEECAILVVDGAGEWATTTLARLSAGKIETLKEIRFPHSLGLLYSAVTEHLGLQPGADEAKVAELAGYGTPRLQDKLARVLRVGDDGGFQIHLEPFRFWFDPDRFLEPAASDYFGPPRGAGAPLRIHAPDSRDADLAASLQCAVEEATLALARELHRLAPSPNLCLAGDLALNPSLNARLAREGPFRRIFAQPAAGDAGGALGAALLAHHALHPGSSRYVLESAFLGESVLEEPGETARSLDETAIIAALVERLAAGQLMGWVRGRFEWGGRSLGGRVLLADPRRSEIRERINTAVKRREGFRPFACAVLAERAAEYFDIPAAGEQLARFKLLAVRARDAARALAPAALHVDGTALPQVVEARVDPLFHRLLTEFAAVSGVGLLLSTSLDLRGDPMVRGEAEARVLFEKSELDGLVVENRLYERS